jgi:hydrogenase nickel incorporation protein HypA/HybF
MLMHEFSIVENLVTIMEQTAKEQHLKKITGVYLLVGKLRQIVPETMQMAFEAATRGTLAESASLFMETVPIVLRCNTCKNEQSVEENVFICQQCHSGDVEVISGEELLLKKLEGEQ